MVITSPLSQISIKTKILWCHSKFLLSWSIQKGLPKYFYGIAIMELSMSNANELRIILPRYQHLVQNLILFKSLDAKPMRLWLKITSNRDESSGMKIQKGVLKKLKRRV